MEASSGLEGLKLAKQARPAAIFLDLIMPEMSGISVLDELKRTVGTQDIPVIINSTRQLESWEQERFEGKIAGFVKKDFSSKDKAKELVFNALKSALARGETDV